MKSKKIKLAVITLVSACVLGGAVFATYSLLDNETVNTKQAVKESKKDEKTAIRIVDAFVPNDKNESVITKSTAGGEKEKSNLISSIMPPKELTSSNQNEKESALLALKNSVDEEQNKLLALQNEKNNNLIQLDNKTPEKPIIPINPEENEKPTNPDKPVLPLEPIDPIVPTDPTEPTEPTDPEVVPTDYSILSSLYEESTSIQLNLYLSISIGHFSNEMLVSSRILSDSNASQEQVDVQVQRLQNSIGELVLKGDKTQLVRTIGHYNSLDKEIYTLQSLAIADVAHSKAVAIRNNPEVSQAQVDEAVQALQSAIDQLTKHDEPLLSLVFLNRVIAQAEALTETDYTPDSYAVLASELQLAKELVTREDLTKAEVEAQQSSLEQAISQLVKKADKAALLSALERATSIDRSLYTVESLTILEQVINSLQGIATDDNATQEDVNNSVALIEEALKQLEVVEIELESSVTDDNVDG